jgi:hypothetical protein
MTLNVTNTHALMAGENSMIDLQSEMTHEEMLNYIDSTVLEVLDCIAHDYCKPFALTHNGKLYVSHEDIIKMVEELEDITYKEFMTVLC